jgi:hypothetical protein
MIFVIHRAQTKLLIVFKWMSNDHKERGYNEKGNKGRRGNHCNSKLRVMRIDQLSAETMACLRLFISATHDSDQDGNGVSDLSTEQRQPIDAD